MQAYADALRLPVRLNARVTSLSRAGASFEVRTGNETFSARLIVVTTGSFQIPFIPAAGRGLDSAVDQICSADYRSPQALPDGSALLGFVDDDASNIADRIAAHRTTTASNRAPAAPEASG
jgi:putative flavoprotein involved in K+ transport